MEEVAAGQDADHVLGDVRLHADDAVLLLLLRRGLRRRRLRGLLVRALGLFVHVRALVLGRLHAVVEQIDDRRVLGEVDDSCRLLAADVRPHVGEGARRQRVDDGLRAHPPALGLNVAEAGTELQQLVVVPLFILLLLLLLVIVGTAAVGILCVLIVARLRIDE